MDIDVIWERLHSAENENVHVHVHTLNGKNTCQKALLASERFCFTCNVYR